MDRDLGDEGLEVEYVADPAELLTRRLVPPRMTMDRARTDLRRQRLRRLLRLLANGIGLLAVLAAGGVVSFRIAERWIVASTAGAAPPGPIDRPRGAGEVSFASGDVILTGELALPPGEGPHPAMVVVHGSGRAQSGHYRWVAETFAPKGFAVLTYDKRGVGRSTGLYTGIGPGNSEAALADLSSDALAGVRWLREHPALPGCGRPSSVPANRSRFGPGG